jgi:hypothetical protein
MHPSFSPKVLYLADFLGKRSLFERGIADLHHEEIANVQNPETKGLREDPKQKGN